MSDQLTDADPAAFPEQPAEAAERPGAWKRYRRSLLQALVIIVAFAVLGVAGGWLWNHLYDAPRGIAYQGKWLGLDEQDYRGQFSGTALYAIIAGIGALVLGTAAAYLLDRDELITLVAIVAGACLAAYVMTCVGESLGNPDPAPLAAVAKDRTSIPGDLRLARWTVGMVWPAAGVLGAAMVFFLTTKRRPRR